MSRRTTSAVGSAGSTTPQAFHRSTRTVRAFRNSECLRRMSWLRPGLRMVSAHAFTAKRTERSIHSGGSAPSVRPISSNIRKASSVWTSSATSSPPEARPPSPGLCLPSSDVCSPSSGASSSSLRNLSRSTFSICCQKAKATSAYTSLKEGGFSRFARIAILANTASVRSLHTVTISSFFPPGK